MFQISIEYLGHVICNGEVRPAASKVEVLFRYAKPKTIVQLQSFLGLANFYWRFIKEFAKIAYDVRSYIKKDLLHRRSQVQSFQISSTCE